MKSKWGIMIGIVIYLLVLKYMFSTLFPFVGATLLFFLLKPFIDCLERYFHIQRNAIGITILLIFYFIIAIFVVYGCIQIFIYCYQMIEMLPSYCEKIVSPLFQNLIQYAENNFPFILDQTYIDFINRSSGQYLIQFLRWISQFISYIPHFFLSFLIFIMATFFLMLEYETIRDYCYRIIPERWLKLILFFKEKSFQSLKMYFRCQMILSVICFCVLLIGFSILKIDYAYLWALITSLLDSMPFIGVGITLIPMMIMFGIEGTYLKSFYLLLIYIMINIIRSFLEPHIMNKQMKIPSFLLLLSMVIHYFLLGFVGIILSPIHMSILMGYLQYQEK